MPSDKESPSVDPPVGAARRSRPRGGPGQDDPWPPHFPHADIDALLERLERTAGLDPRETRDLLGMVAQEAQRLRSTVVRLSAARLTAAEREAAAIVAEAHASASALRAAALEVLDARLDEAERLTASVRDALNIERRRTSSGAIPAPREPRRAGAEDAGR